MLPLAGIVLAAGTLLATRRYGSRRVLPFAGLLSLAVGVIIDVTQGVTPLMGLLAGIQVERRRTFGQTIAASSVPAAVLAGWLLLVQDARDRSQLAAALTGQLRAMGMDASGGGLALREMVTLIVRVQPALEYVSLAFIMLLAYRVAVWGAPRFHVALTPGRPLHLWRPWDELIWVAIGALLLGLVGSGRVRDFGINVAVVMGFVYAVHGLALLRFLLRRYGVGHLVELALYMVVFFTSGLSLVALAGLGLLDTWFDWRRLRPGPPEEGPD